MHKVPSIFEEPCAEMTQAVWIINKILQFDDWNNYTGPTSNYSDLN
jgi:hypothetical protein